MKKFLSVLCLLGLLVLPVVACAPDEPEATDVEVMDEPVETEMHEGMEEMEEGMDEMSTDMHEGMDEMEEEVHEATTPPAN